MSTDRHEEPTTNNDDDQPNADSAVPSGNELHEMHNDSHSTKWSMGDYLTVLLGIAVGLITVLIVRSYIISPYSIPSGSMEPTIPSHSIVLGTKYEEPQLGDVVIFNAPEWGDNLYAKRIMAMPGDKIGGCDKFGRLKRNGEPITETYVNDLSGCEFPEITVPDGRVWVMGDNRQHSADSRYHTFANGGLDLDRGTVKLNDIEAVVKVDASLHGVGVVH